MIGNITVGFTRDAWIEKRTAEGFTTEQAGHEYDQYTDPAIKQAQDQKVPTMGEMMVAIHEAIQNNPDRTKLYNPDFSLTVEYKNLRKELEALKGVVPYDANRAQVLNSQMLKIKLHGLVTDEEVQAEVDKTLEMPIAQIIAERKKYNKVIMECEEKIDNFDISTVQAQVDALQAEYQKKISDARNPVTTATLESEFKKAVAKIDLEYIKTPLNELAVKRYGAKEFFTVYDARLKYFITANKELIEEEIQQAKREEVRGSLVDLVSYMEV